MSHIAINDGKRLGKFKRIIPILLVVLVLFTSVFSVAAFNKNASVLVDGETILVSTFSGDTEEILQKAMVKLGDHDDVVKTVDENGNILLDVKRAFALSVMENGNYKTVLSTGGTVEDALVAAGVRFDEKTKIIPSVDTALAPEIVISVYRPISITIKEGKKETKHTVYEGTLKNVLEQIGAQLTQDDVLKGNVKKSDWVSEAQVIEIDRITSDEITKKQEIEFKTETKKTDDLYVGESKVQQKGVNGEKTLKISRVLKNGEVQTEKVIEEKVTKEPVNKIILEGSKERPTEKATEATETTESKNKTTENSSTEENTTTAEKEEPSTDSSNNITESNGVLYDGNGNEISYSRVLTGSATAYYAAPGALTATGVPAYVGGVAVNPNIIPYGSKLYIVCSGGVVYGYATAVDTGGALMDGSALVDLYYNTYDECVQFGRRTATVYVLD